MNPTQTQTNTNLDISDNPGQTQVSNTESTASQDPETISPTLPISTQDTKGTGINLNQIQAGDYSSLTGSWTLVDYTINAYDGNGAQWYAGAPDTWTVTLSVSSDKIVFNDTAMVMQGNTLIDDAGFHPLSFTNNGNFLDATLADADLVAINWDVSFYPKGVTNDFDPNNGVVIDNTKNLIVVWCSNMNSTKVFAQTDTNS
jgi:hypothetical protein